MDLWYRHGHRHGPYAGNLCIGSPICICEEIYCFPFAEILIFMIGSIHLPGVDQWASDWITLKSMSF